MMTKRMSSSLLLLLLSKKVMMILSCCLVVLSLSNPTEGGTGTGTATTVATAFGGVRFRFRPQRLPSTKRTTPSRSRTTRSPTRSSSRSRSGSRLVTQIPRAGGGNGNANDNNDNNANDSTADNNNADNNMFPLLLGAETGEEDMSPSLIVDTSIQGIENRSNKTEEEQLFIANTLRTNFMFQDLPSETLHQLVNAFERMEDMKSNEVIMKQGDTNADYMYILADGECTVTIDGKVLPPPYGTMTKGTMMGELALLYDAPRAATITTSSSKTNNKVILYRLDRKSFLYYLTTHSDINPDNIKLELREIDSTIDKISGVKTRYGGDIIRIFEPQGSWLWKQWIGTILEYAWKSTVRNMTMSILLLLFVRYHVPHTWKIGMTPDKQYPLIARLDMFGKTWKYLMSLTTFILTFFLSQAYTMWKDMYSTARKIQGRLNDISLIISSSAKRDKDGNYTTKAQVIMDEIAIYIRLLGAFTWAKFSRPYQILISPRGLSRMLSRGLLTRQQFEVLQGLDPSVGVQNAVLEWLTIKSTTAIHDGSALISTEAREHVLWSKLCDLRGTAAGIGDALDGRMPLAYVHFVQVLVDTFLFAAPFGLYAELGIWTIVAVGMLTLFYSGLLDLAKILLDPLGNDTYYKESVNMDIGVLIREMNAGSTRWKYGAEKLPF